MEPLLTNIERFRSETELWNYVDECNGLEDDDDDDENQRQHQQRQPNHNPERKRQRTSQIPCLKLLLERQSQPQQEAEDDEPTEELQSQYHDDFMTNILMYLDVVELVQLKAVSRQFQDMSNAVIAIKYQRPTQLTPFQSNRELRYVVLLYVNYAKNRKKFMELIATKYGFPIGKWNVSQIRDFSEIFCLTTNANNKCHTFNEDINTWDVSNAETMTSMFFGARKFNSNLMSWNTSKVTNMGRMFEGAARFNRNLSSWNTSQVVNMSNMFSCAERFNGDVSTWNTSQVQDMSGMFFCAFQFNPTSLTSWDTSQVRNMSAMFYGA